MRRPLLVRPARLTERSRRLIPGWFGPARIYRWEKTTVVAVKIKLKRMGKIREPYYRIVVADARTKRDGRAIEEIGKYHPKADPSVIEVNSERVQHWLSVGAQPTDPVRVLLKVTGDWQKFHGEPGAEGTLRTAAPRADKREAFAAAASQSQAAKEEKASAKAAPRTARPPKDSAPKDSAPKDSAPKDSAPKDGPAKESKAKVKAEAKPDAKPEAPADAEPAVTAEAGDGA
jgi:small subunit ribosomal protein S16